MFRLNRLCAAVSTVAFAILVLSSPASAQATSSGYRDAHRLGGTTSFHKPPLTNAGSVKRMADARGVAADIRRVLADSGIPETSDAVMAMLSGDHVRGQGNAPIVLGSAAG